MRKIVSCVVAAAALSMSAPAAAVQISTAYQFDVTTAYNAALGCSQCTVVGSQTGQFSVNYDTVSGAFSLTGMNFTLADMLFTTVNTSTEQGVGADGYFGIPAATKVLFIGGSESGAEGVSSLTTDFWLGFIVGANGALTPYNYFENILGVGKGNAFSISGYGQVGTLSLKTIAAVTPPPTPAVPEPGTWATMLVGFAGLGLAMRGARKSAQNQLA